MKDPEIIAAMIAAFTSLIIGVFNLITMISKQKKDKKIVLRQEEFNLEIEKLKAENQKNLMMFKEKLQNEKTETLEKEEKEKSILQSLQLVKDSMHNFQRIIKENGNSLLDKDILQLRETISKYIDSYKTYYMNMNQYEKDIVHSLKNNFHDVITEIEVKQRMNKISESNTEAIVMMNNSIEHIRVIQDDLIEYYDKRKKI